MLAATIIAATMSVGTCDFAAAQNVVDYVNVHRQEAHEQPLVVDPQLTAVALDRASDLANRHYFSHISPDGTTAIDELRNRAYRFGYAGENLALADTIAAADQGLWASPDHRENMLERHYRRIGIAVFKTADGNLVVQIFSD